MTSFDVTSLFTNVPVDFTINLILDSIFRSKVSVSSQKAGRRDFCQSILTYRLETMCAVKINMPKIFKWENRPKTVVQSAFLYLDIVSICGGAVAISNKPFRQWTGPNNSSNVDDLQVRWGLM